MFLRIVGGILVILLGVVVYYELLSWIMAIYGFFYLLLFGVATIYLKIQKTSDDDAYRNSLKTKKTFDYCWDVANRILMRQTGGTAMSWNGGWNRRSEIRYYVDKKTDLHKLYRAFYGVLEGTNQTVIVIYDVELEDIARYTTQLTTELLKDPFYKFDPDGSQSFQNMNMNPYGYNGKKRFSFFNRNYSGQQDEFNSPKKPDVSEYVDNVMDTK